MGSVTRQDQDKAPTGKLENHPPERASLLSGFAARLQEGLGFLRQSHAQRLAAIVESSDDAIISLGLDGSIATWSNGAERLLGYGSEEVIGTPVSALIPPERAGEQRDILERVKNGERIDHYRTIRRRKDGSLVALSLTVSPITDNNGCVLGASEIARDLTDEERTIAALSQRMVEQTALYEFTDRLFRAENLHDIHEAALDAIIGALGCDRASILMFDTSGIMKFVAARGLSEDYRAVVEGHSPWTRDTRNPEPIVTPNVEEAAFDVGLKATIKAEGIGALAFIPLTAKGVLVGKFMTYYNAPHAFTDNDTRLSVTIARQLGFGVERLIADEAKELLLAEMQHRIKNTLTTVQAIAGQTMRSAPAEALDAFMSRLRSLADAHDLLAREHWEQAPVREVVTGALRPFGDRFLLGGPDISLPVQTSLALVMCLHELATNAVKYGALSNDLGKVDISWQLIGHNHARLVWTETGGPPVSPPSRKGFGTLLLEHSFRSGGGGHIDFKPEGARCVLEVGGS